MNKLIISGMIGITGLIMSVRGQSELEECQKAFIIVNIKLDSVRASLRDREKKLTDAKKLDSVNQKSIQEKDTAIVSLKNQIELFKQREAEVVLPSLFEWKGFYVNIGTYLRFDSTVIMTGFTNRFNYALNFDWNVQVLGRLRLTGEIQIPFTEKPSIWLLAGYKLF